MGDTTRSRGLVLVIDDNADLRETYGDLLESHNYRYATARDGEIGLQLVRELRPDAVLLDMVMPDCDGLEFLARLRHESPPPFPPVIANSGFDQFEQEALARGAAAFLKKPIDFPEFRVILDNLMAGEAPDAEVLARHGEKTLAARQRARVLRETLWTKVDPKNLEQRARLDALVLRMSDYFAVVTAVVTLVKEGQILVLAASGGEITAGTVMKPETTLCATVVEGGSSLVLGDTATHACFAAHPGTQSGYRFFACAPLTGSEGFPLGTLSLQDRQPRVFHAEDLMILEHVALGVARRMEAMAGVGTAGPFVFDEPGVFTREALHVLLGAELARSARYGGTVELALIELDEDSPAPPLRWVLAAYGGGGGERFAVATYAKGVLAVLRGAGDPAVVTPRIEQALADLRRGGAVLRGAGIVTYSLASSAVMGELEVERLADEARVRAVSRGTGVEHVVLASRSGPGVVELNRTPAPPIA